MELFINQDKNEFTVQLPKLFAWIGIIGTIFSLLILFLMAIYPNGTGVFWVGVIFGGFILLGLTLTNTVLTWKIEVNFNNDFFIYRTFFWKTIVIKYSEITKVGESPLYLKLKFGKDTLTIDKSANNFDLFNSKLEKQLIDG